MVTKAVLKASPIPAPGLDAYLSSYAHLFRRGTTRRNLERYVTGLLTDLDRKNCDTIAEAVADTSTERLQYMLTDATWDATDLDKERVQTLVRSSPEEGVLILDDTGLPKQGKASVGVAHQYSGTLGKVANCQVVVTAQYMADEPASSQPIHWPVSARLYLPKEWATDIERRQKVRVPDDIEFKDKPTLGLELVDQARKWGVSFNYVVADGGFGDNPSFLERLEERHLLYVCGVHSTFGVRRAEDVRAAAEAPLPEYKGIGTRKRERKPAHLYTVGALVESLPEDAWQTVTWREGTKETLRKQFVAIRVHWATGQWTERNRRSVKHSAIRTGPEGWLLAERPMPGERGLHKWYYSNLPADTPLVRLVTLAHSRWTIERFYQDAKGECGMDNYQGRRWDGLHRHLALAMLSYSFLAQVRTTASVPATEAFSPLSSKGIARSTTPPSLDLAVV